MAQEQVEVHNAIERKVAAADITVDRLCRDALESMLQREDTTQRFTVLMGDCIYFFDVTCIAVKPPYEMVEESKPGRPPVWFGQSAN